MHLSANHAILIKSSQAQETAVIHYRRGKKFEEGQCFNASLGKCSQVPKESVINRCTLFMPTYFIQNPLMYLPIFLSNCNKVFEYDFT